MESEFDERLLYHPLTRPRYLKEAEPGLVAVKQYLLVHIEFSEYFSCIQQVLIVENPAIRVSLCPSV
jgi:hypothetical protein